MKENDIHNLIDRLQGFDSEELQREMTDGLDRWCQQRKQRGREVKRVLLLALLLLTTTAIAMTVLPMLRPLQKSAPSAPAGKPMPSAAPTPVSSPILIDSVVVRERTPEAVDYYYTGMAEDGYSVAYGHDTRTLTYTRYSGNHLIHSVVHNSPDIFVADSASADTVALSHDEVLSAAAPVHSQIPCDFQTVNSQGDALYFVILDSASRKVSVRGDEARWLGQPIRYNTVLKIPATVERDGLSYTVVALSDSAFMGHDEIEKVYIPSTVTYIGDYAFAGCISLERLVVHAAVPPEANPASFDRVDAMLYLSVPCGSANAYSNDAEWLYFRNLSEDCASRAPSIRVIRRP